MWLHTPCQSSSVQSSAPRSPAALLLIPLDVSRESILVDMVGMPRAVRGKRAVMMMTRLMDCNMMN